MKRGTQGVSTLAAAFLVIGIIAASVLTYYLVVQIQITPTPEDQLFYGTVSVTATEIDHLDGSASTSDTGNVYRAYHSYGNTFDSLTEDDLRGFSTLTEASAGDVSILPEDEGHFFLMAYAGSNEYLQITETLAANPRITDYGYFDVDDDNRDEVLFDVDIATISTPNPATKPSLAISVMVDAEDGTTALNSPADQTSVSTGTQTGTIEWQITGIAEKKAEALAKVYVTQNRTQEDYFKVTAVSINGVGTFSGGDITYDSGSKQWSIDIGISDYREITQCPLMERASGDISYVAVTVSWESYFTAAESSQEVNVTLYVITMDADESTNTAISDAALVGPA